MCCKVVEWRVVVVVYGGWRRERRGSGWQVYDGQLGDQIVARSDSANQMKPKRNPAMARSEMLIPEGNLEACAG